MMPKAVETNENITTGDDFLMFGVSFNTHNRSVWSSLSTEARSCKCVAPVAM